MRWTLGTLVGAAVLLAMAGCSTAPNRQEVAERYAIELAGAFGGEQADWIELGETVADDALEGMCGDDTYRAVAFDGNPDMAYAWDSTCLMYFEDDMTDAQVERAKAALVARVLEAD